MTDYVDKLVLSKIYVNVPLIELVTDNTDRRNMKLLLQQRLNYYNNEGMNPMKYMYQYDNVGQILIKYTILVGEYITAIDVYTLKGVGNEYHWNDDMEYHEYKNYNLVALRDATLFRGMRIYGDFNIKKALRRVTDDVITVRITGITGPIVIQSNAVANFINGSTSTDLEQYSQFVNKITFPKSDMLTYLTDGSSSEYYILLKNLTKMSMQGYWTYGARNIMKQKPRRHIEDNFNIILRRNTSGKSTKFATFNISTSGLLRSMIIDDKEYMFDKQQNKYVDIDNNELTNTHNNQDVIDMLRKIEEVGINTDAIYK